MFSNLVFDRLKLTFLKASEQLKFINDLISCSCIVDNAQACPIFCLKSVITEATRVEASTTWS